MISKDMSNQIPSGITETPSKNDFVQKCQIYPERTFGRWRVRIGKEKLGLTADFIDRLSGEKVASYYVNTLLGKDRWGTNIADIEALSLYAGYSDWTVFQPELSMIANWLTDVTGKYHAL